MTVKAVPFIICLGLFYGCNVRMYFSGVAQKSKTFAKDLHTQSYPQKNTGPPDPTADQSSGKARIYVDGSLSMKGYVTGNSEARTKYDHFIDKLANALPGANIFKFGSRGTDPRLIVTTASFDRSSHGPEFYNFDFNPDDLLIRQINSEEKPPLSIILTDGVHSDPPAQGTYPVVDAIQQSLEKGSTIGILSLKSSFNGPFYSELRRGWLPGNVKVSARPFYAFVVSPTTKEFDELCEKLKRDFPELQVILFSDDAVKYETHPSRNSISPFATTDLSPPQAYWHMFGSNIFGSSSSAFVFYELTYRFDQRYPLKELSFNANSNYYSWDGKDFRGNRTTPPSGFFCDVQPGQIVSTVGPSASPSETSSPSLSARQAPTRQVTVVRLNLVKDTRTEYGFYQISIDTWPRFLRDDIAELSTEDDSDVKNADKTYKLSDLLMALSDVHIKNNLRNKISPAIYLTVANK